MLDWLLQSEVTERIVHYLSERPLFKCAQNYVHPKDVLSVLDASEQLRTAARNQFRSPILFHENDSYLRCFYFDDIPYKPEQYPPGLLVVDRALFESLLIALGGSLR